jgi:SAM-dependent methyltransferase
MPDVDDGHLLFAPELASHSEGFREEYFEALSGLESKNFWFRARNELILWALGKHFPGATSMLEIGCGTGFVLAGIENAFPAMNLLGSEIFGSGLALAAKRLRRATLMQMDARNIPFENEFDVVGAFDVLEHIEEDTAVLRQIFTSLQPAGGLMLTVPQHPLLWSRQDEQACHVRRYTRSQLSAKLAEAGFEMVYATSFVSLLLPLMAMSRLKKNVDSASDVLDELDLHPAVNSGLEKVMTFERSLVKAGVPLPVGGSLLVVARKPRAAA